jgi:acyl dehydratase
MIGDTISARATATEKRTSKKPGSGVLTLRFEVVNQRNETVQVGTATLLMKTRPAA